MLFGKQHNCSPTSFIWGAKAGNSRG